MFPFFGDLSMNTNIFFIYFYLLMNWDKITMCSGKISHYSDHMWVEIVIISQCNNFIVITYV